MSTITGKKSAPQSRVFAPNTEQPPVPSSWWSAVLVVVAVWLGASLVANIIVLLVVPPPDSGGVPVTVVLGSLMVTQMLVASATLAYVWLRAKRAPLAILGFRSTQTRRALTALAGGIVGAAVLEVLLRAVIPAAWRPEHFLTTAVQNGTPIVIGLVVITGVVIAPLVEEAVFRGYLMGALAQRFGFIVAALGSSAVFGLVHLTSGLVSAGFAFLLGLVLCWVYKVSGSLWVNILIHAATNAVAFTVALGIFG